MMVEVNCETDFVAKSTEFQALARTHLTAAVWRFSATHLPLCTSPRAQELAKAIAMQVAACPTVFPAF